MIPEETLKQAIDKFIKKGKITKNKNGTLLITKWDKYQLSRTAKFYAEKGRSERSRSQSEPKRKVYNNKIREDKIKKDNRKYIVYKIIKYFNKRTDQKRSFHCQETIRLINGRLNEGRTIDDFKHVIDTKFTQWQNNDRMRQFIRPSTLFRPGNFEDYLNEPYENPDVKKLRVGESYLKGKKPLFEMEFLNSVYKILQQKDKTISKYAKIIFSLSEDQAKEASKNPEEFISFIEDQMKERK